MKCLKCNSNAIPHKQKIDKNKTEIIRWYYCKHCHTCFQTKENYILTEEIIYAIKRKRYRV